MINCKYYNNDHCNLIKNKTGIEYQLNCGGECLCTQCLKEQNINLNEDNLTPILDITINKINVHKINVMPTLFEKMLNYTESFIKYKLAGSPTTPTEIQNEHLTICESCDSLEPVSRSCYECGCPVDEKVKWGTERCPLGKWETVVDSKVQPAEPHDSSAAGCGCGS